ncbi:[Pyruvate dehydrogenase (acetyl-transferring)] kinase, mitochondrial [Tetrabaena socialis]|uniref:Protein-serine/threonine kinase n=1 Tax=Tetrabaena socialis TaxID=47790 RepID=A0A2J8A164_9CHLO|nr:[Pyruvate dehydrogenase (acetyl-transferring)] kinase, mitochondrial [Tetrabaena socialis]|eukprot:PNH06263.1 [Pyruvate dehydrogenase (acetyl-transferring)] kinase, mitochondrial [Tetrabaena socialis]
MTRMPAASGVHRQYPPGAERQQQQQLRLGGKHHLQHGRQPAGIGWAERPVRGPPSQHPSCHRGGRDVRADEDGNAAQPTTSGRLPAQFRGLLVPCGAASNAGNAGLRPALAPLRRSYQTVSPGFRADIQAAAAKKQTGVSLKHLLDFGTQPLERQMFLSARFLHAEIPIRLAHRLTDLNNLPRQLSEEPHVRRVKGWYAASFDDFRSFPHIKDGMDVINFTQMLKNAFRRHNNVVPAIAKGVEIYKTALERSGESTEERESEIQHFLDTFFLSRIAIRFLAGHHIQIAADAVAEARAMCFREYGTAPAVTMRGNTSLTMAYVPSHLHHMVFELVKNSLRAVQDRYADSDSEPPAIQVVVAEGLEDVTIKVSDQGGGIPRSGLQRIWTYLYTTARSPLPEVDIDSSMMPAVLAGYGCGLPLSRLYARYFGGDLQIISMEGYGTDAYLHLARLGNDEEPLPGSVP